MFYQNPSNYINTLYGMYSYDPTLFDNITVPDGLNKDTLIAEIMAECGENEVLYPNIPLLKHMILTFFDSHSYKYQKLYETMNYEYEPLENYNVKRTRTYTREENGTDSRETGHNITRETTSDITREQTENKTRTNKNDTTVNNSSNGTSTTISDVSAYNSADYVPSTKTVETGESTNEGTQNVTESGTEDNSVNENENNTGNETENKTEKESNTHIYNISESEDSNEYGDNSARSAMYAIQEQRNLVNFNLYKIIASDFEDDITIPVYTKTRTDLFTGGVL